MEKKKINENMVDDFYNVKQSVVDSIKTALKDGKELDEAISETLDTIIYTDDQWAIIQHYLTPDQTLDEGHTLIGIAEELFYNELYNEWQDYEDDEPTNSTNVLNEGAGAGYDISGDLSDIKINKINKINKFTSTNFIGTELEFATIDVDADATFDGDASSYYYGKEIHDAPVKITALYVNPNLLRYLGLEEFEYDKVTAQDLQDQISGSLEFVKSDVIGGGWSHVTFDGNVESHSVDDKYKTFIDGVKFYFVNKDTIEYIDKAVSGELEENNEDDEDVSWDEKANAYKGELPWDSSKHFDDDIDENLSNQLDESVSKDAQEVVNPVMADALRDQEEAEKVKEKATEITKDGKPTIKNESLATFDPFSALGKLEENIKRGI